MCVRLSGSELVQFFELLGCETRGGRADLLLAGLGSSAGGAVPVAASLRHKAAAGVAAGPKAPVECSGHSRVPITICKFPASAMVG